MAPLTTEEFIRRGKEKHGDKYDYSRTVYVNVKTKVEIVCPKHGPFWQWPRDHWRKAGCPTCANRSRSMSRAEFVDRASEIHGGRYDYGPVEFVTTKIKVQIGCAEHGPFWQRPDHHLRGHGCPECGRALSATANCDILNQT